MTTPARIRWAQPTRCLAFALGLLLVGSATDALAAGKRRAGSRGKPPAQIHEAPVRAVPVSTPEPAAARAKPGPSEVRASETRTPVRESARQESRIEFDERMLRGQSAAGVIYLFQRTPSDWKSIVEVPDSFRPRTVNVLAPVEEKK
jgi:hypothetical protein